VAEANAFVDLETIEREQPGFAAKLARLHDRNKKPGYWRDLVRQLAANLAVNPAYTEDDLKRIPVPTLLMAGEDDLWGNLNQMTNMKRNIPNSELLIINHAPHEIQHTHPSIVGPVVMEFLERWE
jgi:pimeloyl-ACP methyl ester carboxylesterase